MDFQVITNWINQNQGLLAIILFLFGGVGFFIKKLFFSDTSRSQIQKQKAGDNSVNIQSGKDTNYGSK